MNNIKIQNLISDGENLKLEFKQSFDKEAIETITAFANAKGGVLLVGVKDSGETLGVSVGAETIQNYINQVKNSTEPSLIVDIESIEIANMHLQSLQLSWDAYESVDSEFDDLDDIKIDKFFTKVNQNGRFKLSDDRVQNLQKLNLIKGIKPTNAAKLLFAKEQNIYNIHIGRFKTPDMILDDRMIRLPLFEAVEETMYYIISHIKVAFEFTGELQRTEIFEYPRNALRELVLNAIVHRDYTSPIDTQIKIFDNSITFFNPGRLYGDMTIEKLSTDNYQAQTRNKLIAEAFYLTGDIEKYGSGYIRIRQAVSEYPTMKLKYEEMGNGYLVTISYEQQKTSIKSLEVQASDQVSDQVSDQAILEFCKEAKSTQEIMDFVGMKHKTYFRKNILNPLLEKELLELTIPDKLKSPKQKYKTKNR